jgi:hypothetical protein
LGSGQHGVKDRPCGTGGQIMAQFKGKGDASHITETICRIIPDVGLARGMLARVARLMLSLTHLLSTLSDTRAKEG